MERGYASVVTDPYDSKAAGYDALKLKGDIVTVSHNDPAHNAVDNVKGTSHVIDSPGEFEIGGVFITGVQTDSGGKKAKDSAPRNTLYVFDFEGLIVAHLGDLRSVPTQSEIELLGTVHIALVPVGGGTSLNAAKAAEVVSLLEPNIVIPMHYATKDSKPALDPLNKFLKEMGLTKADTAPMLKISRSGLPDETRVVVLEYQNS
jgi:L-ascorbate metabolism protein UlaG (beta-lactamase superfamily)